MVKIEPIDSQDLSADTSDFEELRIDIQLLTNKINEIIGVLNSFYTPETPTPEHGPSRPSPSSQL